MLQYITVCYSMLQYVTVCYSMLQYITVCYSMLHYVTVCYIMLQYVTVCYSMLHYVTVCYIMLHYVTVCYSMLQYVTLHTLELLISLQFSSILTVLFINSLTDISVSTVFSSLKLFLALRGSGKFSKNLSTQSHTHTTPTCND